MFETLASRPAQSAVVARTELNDCAAYLQMAEGRLVWVADPAAASTFASMREAMRMALRLPSGLRAYGLPRDPELALN